MRIIALLRARLAYCPMAQKLEKKKLIDLFTFVCMQVLLQVFEDRTLCLITQGKVGRMVRVILRSHLAIFFLF